MADTDEFEHVVGRELRSNAVPDPRPGTCPDDKATPFARSLADLRHWKTMGHAQRFPIGQPTEVTFDSQPFASVIPAGDRITLIVTGGASVLQANERQPLLTIHTGRRTPGTSTSQSSTARCDSAIPPQACRRRAATE